MKIKIRDKELELVSPLMGRTHLFYENITGESLEYDKINNFTTLSYLMYSNILASLQKEKLPLDYTWEDFMDFIDTEDFAQISLDYVNWIAKLLGVRELITEDLPDIDKNNEPSLKKT